MRSSDSLPVPTPARWSSNSERERHSHGPREPQELVTYAELMVRVACDDARRETTGSWARRLLTVVLIAALLSPAVRNHDGLPLSTYPMYAGTRSNLSGFVTASGIDERGDRVTLSASTISGSRDPLIAQSFLNDAVRRGDAADVCSEIAARVDRPLDGVEIATEQHDTIIRLQGGDSLQDRDVHAACEVPR